MKHVYTATYSSRSNLVERVHQQLGRTLRIFVNKLGRAWDDCLTEAAFAFNISDLSTAPYSPFFLMHGFNPNLKIDRKLLGNTSENELKKEDDEAITRPEPVRRQKTANDEVGASHTGNGEERCCTAQQLFTRR